MIELKNKILLILKKIEDGEKDQAAVILLEIFKKQEIPFDSMSTMQILRLLTMLDTFYQSMDILKKNIRENMSEIDKELDYRSKRKDIYREDDAC